MNVTRRMMLNVDGFRVGDQIKVGKYTATCQKATNAAGLFLLDQYLDKPYQMNSSNTNEGGYEESDLRSVLNNDLATDHNFDEIRSSLIPFMNNGDLFSIPTVGEMFGDRYGDYFEMDDAEQWPLMKDRSNRIASREGEEYEWGWLQNKVKRSASNFAHVYYNGLAVNSGASDTAFGVRPVFMVRL